MTSSTSKADPTAQGGDAQNHAAPVQGVQGGLGECTDPPQDSRPKIRLSQLSHGAG